MKSNTWLKYIIFSLLIKFSYGVAIQIPKALESNVSVNIIDEDSGNTVYTYKNNVPRLIASNVKLFTTLFGLTYLSPDFHWHTSLKYDGEIRNHTLYGNVYLQGGGDPTLDTSAVYLIMSQLKRLGVSNITGTIILDSSLFNDQPTYSMLQSNWYDADKIAPSGLIINGNRANFIISVSGQKISVSDNLYNIKVVNQLQLEKKDNNSCDMDDTVTPYYANNVVTLQGDISKDCDGKSASFFILPGFKYNMMVLSQVLSDLGISAKLSSGTTPKQAKLIYDYKSLSLSHIIYDMNKTSNNLYASTIISSIGAYKTANNSSFGEGGKIYYKFLKNNDLYNHQFKLENGAGLSRYEFFTADEVAHLLDISDNSAFNSIIEASLPVPTEEGTLQDKFTDFAGRLKVKTGTLNDTRAYSGYFYAKNGHKYIVVFIADSLTKSEQKELFTNLINQALHSLDRNI